MTTRTILLLAGLLSALPGCGDPNCETVDCSKYGGSASKTFSNCLSSGSGSSKDQFWLKDSSGKEFFRCERPADDNDSCGVELITAKENYCKG